MLNSVRSHELEHCKNQKQFPLQWQQIQPIVQDLLKLDWNKFATVQAKICVCDDRDSEGADALRNALQAEILQFISEAREQILVNKDALCLLRAYSQEWTKFSALSDYFFLLFQILENVSKGNKYESYDGTTTKDNSIVRKLMLNMWNENIFAELEECLQSAVMELVHTERNGEVVDSNLVTVIRETYVNLYTNDKNHLTIYYTRFEKPYLDDTKDFYNAKCQEYLAVNGIRNYMAWADAKLKEEEERAKKYLETASNSNSNSKECTSMATFMDVCVQVFVASFKDLMLAEVAQMIRDNEAEQLALMFGLVDRIPDGINPVLRDLETHIFKQGLADMEITSETILSGPEQYVQKLIDLFYRFSSLVENAFLNDPRFLVSRDKAYQKVVNDTSVLPTKNRYTCVTGRIQPESKCPELLANFCDLLFRKSPRSKKISLEEMQQKAKEIVKIMK